MLFTGAAALGLAVLGTASIAYAQTTSGYTQVSGAPFAESSSLAGTEGEAIAVDPMDGYVAVAGITPPSGNSKEGAMQVALDSVASDGALTEVASLTVGSLPVESGSAGDWVMSATFNSTGTMLAVSTGVPAAIVLIKVDTSGTTPTLTEAAMKTFSTYTNPELASVAFSPSGPFLAAALGSGESAGQISGEVLTLSSTNLSTIDTTTLPASTGTPVVPYSLAFSPGGHVLLVGAVQEASSGPYGSIDVVGLDPTTGGSLAVSSSTRLAGPVTDLAFDPQGAWWRRLCSRRRRTRHRASRCFATRGPQAARPR